VQYEVEDKLLEYKVNKLRSHVRTVLTGSGRCPYVRSEHLDGVVWLLMEASTGAERDVSTTKN
jgi:hypothetical protein